jgi:phospholipid/cholesterol/gamma-HCH transport system substrate-binding protein
MDVKYSREVAVGTFVLVAIAIFVFATMWLSGRSLSPDDEYVQVRFENAAGLKEGSPVRVSGVNVGRVERIEFEGFGRIMTWLSLPDVVDPRADATAEIVSVSLVGDYAVDFTPGSAPEPLPADAVITGTREGNLSDLGTTLGARADTLMQGLNEFANPEMAAELEQTLAAMQQTLAALASSIPATTRQTTATMASLERLSDQLAATLAGPAFQNTVTNLDSLTANAAATSAQLTATLRGLDTLLAAVNDGRGTLGLLATDSTLYWNLVGATGQLDSLIAELKRNPGRIQVVAPVKIF